MLGSGILHAGFRARVRASCLRDEEEEEEEKGVQMIGFLRGS